MRISDWSSDVCSSDLALDDPHTALYYQFFQDRFESIGVAAIRPQCHSDAGERFLFAWLPSFTDGLIVSGIRPNDPSAPMHITGHLLVNPATGDRKSTRLNSSH